MYNENRHFRIHYLNDRMVEEVVVMIKTMLEVTKNVPERATGLACICTTIKIIMNLTEQEHDRLFCDIFAIYRELLDIQNEQEEGVPNDNID